MAMARTARDWTHTAEVVAAVLNAAGAKVTASQFNPFDAWGEPKRQVPQFKDGEELARFMGCPLPEK
jgi:hypothetical protein